MQKRNLKYQAEPEFDTIYIDDGIVCPYCGYKDEETWEYPVSSDDDEALVTCVNCDKHFTLNLSVDYYYTSTKVEPQYTPRERLELVKEQIAEEERAHRFMRKAGKPSEHEAHLLELKEELDILIKEVEKENLE